MVPVVGGGNGPAREFVAERHQRPNLVQNSPVNSGLQS